MRGGRVKSTGVLVLCLPCVDRSGAPALDCSERFPWSSPVVGPAIRGRTLTHAPLQTNASMPPAHECSSLHASPPPPHTHTPSTCGDSSPEEVEALMAALRHTLRSLGVRPGMVTIALSSDDEYVPRGLDRRLLAAVLDMLRSLYGDRDLEVEDRTEEDGE